MFSFILISLLYHTEFGWFLHKNFNLVESIFAMWYRGWQKVGLVKFNKHGKKKGEVMEELDLDYVIIKLKKKSSRPEAEKKS